MIVETSANQFFRVVEPGDELMSHCWYGMSVKKTKDGWVETKDPRHAVLVRKAGCRVVKA